MKPVNRISNNGAGTKKKKLLASLTETELQQIREAQFVVDHAKKQYKLMFEGLQSTWRKLGDKYKLPREFDLEVDSGKIFTKGK
jgi:lipoate-protein ligase A